jgi:hypothetical protein
MLRSAGCLVPAVLTALAAAGCGRATGDVSGTVTYGGKAVPVGTVAFYDADGQWLASSPISGGTYSVAGVPTGPATIAVTTPRAGPGRRGTRLPPPPPRGAKKTARPKAEPVTVPDKYGSPAKSGLTYTVKTGTQVHDLQLKEEPPPE